MFHRLKRAMALVMTVTLVSGCLIGCGSKNNRNEEPDSESPVTIKVYSELAGVDGKQGGWSAKVLLDKFNVELEIVASGQGVYDTIGETEDAMDILAFGGEYNYREAVKKGLLYDWNKDNLLAEHGSYIKDHMQAALAKNQRLTSEITGGTSDTLYGFGFNVATSIEDHDAFLYTWDIRWDLYKQLNYPEVKNLDDLIEVLADMKELCPTDANGEPTYAVSLWPDWDADMVMYVKSLASAYYGYDEFPMGLYDSDTGTYYDALLEDGPYLETLKFFNKLYQRGLLDPDSKTQEYEDSQAKLAADGTFWSVFNYAGSLAYNEEKAKEDKIMCSLLPEEASPVVYGISPEGGNRIWTIAADTENPELCMEIINWLCTPEGYMTYLYGPKDLCWYYDEDGYTHFTEFGEKVMWDRAIPMEGEYAGTGTFNDGCLQINNTTWSGMAANPDSNGEVYNWEFWKSQQKEPKCDMEADWREYFDVSATYEYFEQRNHTVVPASGFKLAEKSGDLATIWETMQSIVVGYSWDAIYADTDAEFDQIVSNMISEANKAGYEQCVTWAMEQAELRHAAEEQLRANLD